MFLHERLHLRSCQLKGRVVMVSKNVPQEVLL